MAKAKQVTNTQPVEGTFAIPTRIKESIPVLEESIGVKINVVSAEKTTTKKGDPSCSMMVSVEATSEDSVLRSAIPALPSARFTLFIGSGYKEWSEKTNSGKTRSGAFTWINGIIDNDDAANNKWVELKNTSTQCAVESKNFRGEPILMLRRSLSKKEKETLNWRAIEVPQTVIDSAYWATFKRLVELHVAQHAHKVLGVKYEDMLKSIKYPKYQKKATPGDTNGEKKEVPDTSKAPKGNKKTTLTSSKNQKATTKGGKESIDQILPS